MIIRGSTVGTTMPRTNYEQTDPRKADYLRGKGVLDQKIDAAQNSADQAQTAADLAQECADQALAAVDAARAEAKAYTDAAQAEAGAYTDTAKAEAKSYTDTAKAEAKSYTDSKRLTKTATITTTWSGSGPYSQNVSVPGILTTDHPHITPVYPESFADSIAIREAWSMVSKADAWPDKITVVCFEDKPATAIPIQIEVIR